MAIRERKGRKSPWQAYWNNPITGKRESADFLTEQEAKKHDSLLKHRIKFDRESFSKGDETEAEAEAEEKHDHLTLEACYIEYLKQKQFSKKSLTWQMDSIRYPLKKIGNMPIESINRKHVEQIMDDMLQTNVKPVTVRGRLSVLRTVFRWCSEKGYCEPMNFPKLPPAHYEKFIPPTQEELHGILSHASPHIVRVAIIGFHTGVRIGQCELLQLTWDDVDFDRKIIIIHGSKKNKRSPWREVPIQDYIVHLFMIWKEKDMECGARHIINYNGEHIASIKTAWKKTLERAGITRRIRPYDLRHAFATALLETGSDVGVGGH